MAEIDLTKLTSAELVEALIKDNSIASEFDRLYLWKKFDSDDWSHLLSSQPQFTEKAKEYSHGWAGLLSIKPELANECECWEKFYSWQWSGLLETQPQFADKCTEYNGWKEFDSDDWSELLSVQPHFADKCTEYKGWEEFDSSDWRNLLKAQPQFADKCPDKIYDEFSQEQWAELEAKHPEIFKDKHMLSTLRKLAK